MGPGVGESQQAVLIERSVLVCKFRGMEGGGGPQGGWLELRGIWSYSKRRRAHFHATHAKSLTSRSPASHPLAAQTTSAKGSKFGQVFFFIFFIILFYFLISK